MSFKLSDFNERQQRQIRDQLENNSNRVRAVQSKPDERLPLDLVVKGEEACWYVSPCSFEIVFTVYSRRPCDWDGYDIKALQDFLVKSGVLPGDGWKTLIGRVCSCKAATQAEERTEIEIITRA
jgi:hypothetical protein